MKLKLLKHNQIDKQRWNKVIKDSYNRTVYGFSWYLDIVSPKWLAIVSENYRYIMPVPAKWKLFFKVSLQPYFAQQLGIFSKEKISQDIILSFISVLSKSFSYVELNMNKVIDLSNIDILFRENKTYELDLILPYKDIIKQYNNNTKRNLKKCNHSGITFTENISPKEFIQFFKKNIDDQIVSLKKKNYNTILDITKHHIPPFFLPPFIAAKCHKKICAMAFFIKTIDKIIYMFGSSNLSGKETLAMFGIIDYTIKKFSEKNIILDFEGSNIANIARMYHGFGAKPYLYDTLIINNLPFSLKKKK